ncbi:serine/threonine protein kinase [Methanosarcina sp. KYL-1]|nr:serine/threonine protein kinase [Methanosarcina sp. KYL-1]
MFWVYYEYNEFLQGYAFSRELYWDVPVQRLNLETGTYPGADTGDRVVVSGNINEDNMSEIVGGFLSLLMLVLLFVALKKRKPKTKNAKDSGALRASPSKNNVGKKSSSGEVHEEIYPPKTWIGKMPPSGEASSQAASASASGAGGEAEGGAAESKGPSSGTGPVKAKPEIKSEIKSEVKSEIKSEVDSGVKSEADPEVTVGTGAVAGAVAGAGVEPETSSSLEGFPAALLSQYEPLELLGKGGFAAVFKVKRKADEETVALKIPRIDEKTSSFFIKEVAAWYNLNHPNIVRLYKSDLLPVPYLEMEFVEGADCKGRQVRELDQYPKPFPEAGALKLIRGIAEGLSHAHSRGIFHHDLKPLNILLNSELSPKITDFGLAKIGARNSLTTHNAYSPLYAAPEQLDEEMYGKPDQRTDIYQIGLVFYELLAGKLPYSGCSMGALLGKIVSKEVKPAAISKTDPALGRYDGVFEKLLAQEKADRYQDVYEFLSALDALERLDLEEEEMKNSLEKTKQTLKLSTSREEIERMTREVVEKTSKVALLYARVNEKPELLQALEDLGDYAGENRAELDSAVSQLEYMIRNGIPLGKEFEEGLKVLLGRIEGAAGKE